jgi:ubiquinone/menaquinone biosynthesis C-methylase UbiE
MIRFRERSTETEQMDDPHLSEKRIKAVLGDINRANALLGGNQITLKALGRFMDLHPRKEYSILDAGCGDGTLLREVGFYCRKRGVTVRLHGIDLNGKSVELARQMHADMENMTFEKADLFHLEPGNHRCDLLLCTLTLHHFRDGDIVKLLRKFSAMAKIGVIVNDLDRNKMAYLLFKLFSALTMKTEIAKQDGLVSIKSGFTKEDLRAFSTALTAMEHRIRWRWAFRYEWMFWHPNQEKK